ncbi:uncharacterized protein LOC120670832 isoform X2 [Panicum virgatum]|uniref:uncharacterized protein LOC120670832 isoform X2 n=1 Tax=Panicum virgatum TaxID=38727 RepID=UPI0019D51ABA|nr:uncharacterized protein LOC120670832 isoform X2 [Panicum virgatum]
MAPGPVLGVRQLGARRGSQGAVPGDPGRLLRSVITPPLLSDSNKRFLYDVGVYDSEDDAANLSGMGDFLGEMADMMSQATPTETFEELQQLFVDMFQDDLDPGLFGGLPPSRSSQSPPSTSSPPPPLRPPPGRNNNAQAPPARLGGVGKRGGSPAAHSAAKRPRPGRGGGLQPDLGLSGFCFMVSETRQMQAPCPWTTCEVGGGASRDVAGDGMQCSFRQSQGGGAALWQ